MKARADRPWMQDGRVFGKPRLRKRDGRWWVTTAGAGTDGSVHDLRNKAATEWATMRNVKALQSAKQPNHVAPRGCPVPLDDDEPLLRIAEAMQMRPPWLDAIPVGGWDAAVQEVAGYGPFN